MDSAGAEVRRPDLAVLHGAGPAGSRMSLPGRARARLRIGRFGRARPSTPQFQPPVDLQRAGRTAHGPGSSSRPPAPWMKLLASSTTRQHASPSRPRSHAARRASWIFFRFLGHTRRCGTTQAIVARACGRHASSRAATRRRTTYSELQGIVSYGPLRGAQACWWRFTRGSAAVRAGRRPRRTGHPRGRCASLARGRPRTSARLRSALGWPWASAEPHSPSSVVPVPRRRVGGGSSLARTRPRRGAPFFSGVFARAARKRQHQPGPNSRTSSRPCSGGLPRGRRAVAD